MRLGSTLAALILAACSSRPSTILEESPDAVLARLQVRAIDAKLGGGAVRYLGFEALPEGAFPGDQVTVIHYWVATQPIDAAHRVFVHALLEGAGGWVPHADHDPLPATDHWPPGKVIRDEHPIRLPDTMPGAWIELRVGLYRGNSRMPVDSKVDDGSSRIIAGRFDVSGDALPLPEYRAPRLAKAPTIDGIISEGEWGAAAWIDGFTQSRGDRASTVLTRARMAWQPGTLFLAMTAEDSDIQATMKERDDPVYREETLEIFIDANRDHDSYVELQVSPANVQFDAAFRGGARQNMDTTYDAKFVTAVTIDGELNAPSPDDRGWTTEWAIDVASVRGAGTSLRAGDAWRINLFRIAKDRDDRGQQIADESAWSPPLMGDLHNLERFGVLWFVENAARADPPGAESNR